MDQLSDLGLEPDFELYVRSILDICDGREVKAVAVQALASEAKEKLPFKQFELEQKESI